MKLSILLAAIAWRQSPLDEAWARLAYDADLKARVRSRLKPN